MGTLNFFEASTILYVLDGENQLSPKCTRKLHKMHPPRTPPPQKNQMHQPPPPPKPADVLQMHFLSKRPRLPKETPGGNFGTFEGGVFADLPFLRGCVYILGILRNISGLLCGLGFFFLVRTKVLGNSI